MQKVYTPTVLGVAPAAFYGVPVGPAIPDPATDPDGYVQAMQQIYKARDCPNSRMYPLGWLIHSEQSGPDGSYPTAVVAPGCVRRLIPSVATLIQFQERPTPSNDMSLADFEAIPAGPAMPDYATDPAGFEQAMREIYGSAAQAAATNATPTPATTPATEPTLTPLQPARQTPTTEQTLTPLQPAQPRPTAEPTLTPLQPARQAPTTEPTLTPLQPAQPTPTVEPTLTPLQPAQPTLTPLSPPTASQ